MSKKDKDSEDTPKKGGKLKLIIGAVVLMLSGAGGVYGAMAAGFIGGGEHGESQPKGPELVLKGHDDPYAPAGGDKEKSAGETVHGEGGSQYRTAYYSFEEGFTSNFVDTAGLIQVNLAASTTRDGRVLQWLDMHRLAVRSAILIELANTPEEDVYSEEGKERLQKRLAKAIDEVLIEKEGFGGIDQVYFEAFLVQ